MGTRMSRNTSEAESNKQKWIHRGTEKGTGCKGCDRILSTLWLEGLFDEEGTQSQSAFRESIWLTKSAPLSSQ
jgi:hypothetical protein